MDLQYHRFCIVLILFGIVNGSIGIKSTVDVSGIEYVHVVFMNHLDVGFDGITPTIGFAINVINKYFDEYFPRAIDTAQQLRNMNATQTFIYTTHPWLVSIYLDCPDSLVPQNFPGISVPLHCPNASQVQAFEDAINRGDIAWHAFPFNGEAELLDPSLFAQGFSIAHDLDTKFGKNKTITMSQRDVPGLTRSVIPLMNSVGVRALTVGVNGGSSPPAVPSVFVWKDEQSNSDILAMWHPGGYGGIGVSDCVIVPGLSHALAFAFRSDNAGPPEVDEVIQNYATLQQEFPNAVIKASTYDEFVKELETVKAVLPIITSEIGDTWIHGVQSDPLKVSQFRTILRLRSSCIQSHICDPQDPQFKRFDRLLIKVAEHTWGLDVKTYLHDTTNWSNGYFELARKHSNYLHMESSWLEQRAYITNAIQALGSHPLAKAILQGFEELIPTVPSPTTSGYEQVTSFSTIFQCGPIEIGFNSTTGSVNHLVDTSKNRKWATEDRQLGLFQYQTLTGDDYSTFIAAYDYCGQSCLPWFPLDFGKPNVGVARPADNMFLPQITSLWQRQIDGHFSFLVESKMPRESYVKYGAPQSIWTEFDVVPKTSEVHIKFQWFNKTATRLPEAHWYTFNPLPQQDDLIWSLSKLGENVSPFDVVLNGSHHFHGVNSVEYSSTTGAGMKIHSTDVALVVPGKPDPFPTPLDTKSDTENYGVSFNMYNNIWGTNYIMWYPYIPEDSASLFRFKIELN